MDLLYFLIIGVIAGWLTGKLMSGGGYGLFGDLVVGIIGAIIGGWVLGLVGISAGGFIGRIVSATFGAVLCVFLVRLIKKA
ncbi:MAG: GlsB/YeaQ/YmgE family stress response membrane protein [Acidobacteria bacterium]|nr:GlsB/YeaQ/YmgE family stress response membrane protein [Acidobacteriota bacterium]